MTKEEKIDFIIKNKFLFIIRTEDFDGAMKCFDALVEAGAKVIEFTSTIPNYEKAIKEAKEKVKGEEILVGAGTVLNKELALKAMEGNPDFVVNPTQNFEILEVVPKEKVVFMGGFTPSEIIRNYYAGVDFVKVFPASVLGPKFIKALKFGPLPFVKMLASGGMELGIIEEFIKAGADVIGLGSEVARVDLIMEGNFSKIKELAKSYLSLLP
jgi:2-dehydro-3-deoxyphosphogluconate aldolase/(4S)-4-hydroxy-2-oxoglutarate aldolase